MTEQTPAAAKPAGASARKLKVPRQYRDMQVDEQALDAAKRTMTFPFSSETPVPRFFGDEILSHDRGAMRLDRAKRGAVPLLFNHDPKDPIGMVDTISIGNDRRGYATAHFFDTPRAQDVMRMVEQGMRNVSVGYDIYKVEENTKTNAFRVTDWQPLEISVAPVPADASVGVGRAASSNEEQEVEVVECDELASTTAVRSSADNPAAPAAATPKGNAMSEATTAAAGANADTQVRNDGTQIERLRIKAVNEMCRQHKIDDKTREEWIDGGVTADVAATKVLDILAERGRTNPQSPAQLGMTPKETRAYSMHRAINALLSGKWDKAGLEFEAHKVIRDRLNRNSSDNGFFIPVEIQERALATHDKRDLTVATSSAGGYLVETSNQGFIDILRNRSVAMAMGARRLTGLQGNLTIPKQTGAVTAYWLSTEATAITEGAVTFGQLALSPKNVGAYVEISRQLLLQSSPSAEQLTMSDLATQLGLAVDTASISGSGSSGQPTGILNTSGVGTSATGTTLGYAGLITMQTDVAGANALTDASGYVTTPTVAGLLMGRQRFSNTDTPVWDGSLLDAKAAGFKAMSSNQMPSAQMIFGDWSQLVIAEWGVLEVEVNPVANFQAGIVGVRAIYSVDIGVRVAGAFSKVASIT